SIFRRFGDAANEAPLLITLGIANRNLGRLDEAEQAYLRAIEFAKERELREVMANATNNLGTLYSRRGNLDVAQKSYQSAFEMYQRQGSTINAGQAYSNIAGILTRRGEYARAEEICREVLTSFRKIEHRSGIGIMLFDLGIIQFLRGRVENGQTNCNQGIEIAMQLGEHRRVHHRLHEVAWFLTISREQNAATRYFARAKEYLPKKAEVENLQRILAVRAWHQFDLGNIEKAFKLTEQALRQSTESGKTLSTLFVLLIHGRLLVETGELEKAGEELLKTRQGYVELRMPFYEALTCRALADYYHKQGQPDKRDAVLKEGLALARKIGAMRLIPWFEEMLDNFAYNC
ncbi:tetratricopeptide repeat protein, partial [bacterium]|nr:tetratricopeptide repeat protein [bacterium]